MTIDQTVASALETESVKVTETIPAIVPVDGNDDTPEAIEMGSYPEYWIG
jgi:hypothetical protein